MARDRDGGTYFPPNRALFCPKCGEVWGRITTDRPNALWASWVHYCRRCWSPNLPLLEPLTAGTLADDPSYPGSIHTFADDWPAEAVKWEFLTLLTNYERFLHDRGRQSST